MGMINGGIGNECGGTPMQLPANTNAWGLFDASARSDHCRTSPKQGRGAAAMP
jgi:hypothetical protein